MNAIDKIIENMPKNLEINTQIRYIYLELGKIFKKDIAFFYGTDEEKQKIYDMEADINFSEKLSIICKSSAKVYQYAFSKLGIDSELIKKPTNSPFQHIDLIVKGENNKKYYLSPMEDLFRIQMGMRTKRFGNKTDKFKDLDGIGELSYFSEEEIKEMDSVLGYTFKGMYTDDVIDMIRDEALSSKILYPLVIEKYPKYKERAIPKDLYATFKIEFLLKFMNYRNKLNGYIEYKDYIDYMLNAITNRRERKKIKRTTIYKTKEDGSKDLKALINVSTEKGHIYYILTNDKRGYVKTDDIADYMLKNDLQFIRDSKRDLETGNNEPEDEEPDL